jgi:hypothetical protein
LVATVTRNVLAQNEGDLSTELVKSNTLVEAQEEFRFDEPTRTVVLSVASTIITERLFPEVAYGLATDPAPVSWEPEALANARPDSLVALSVTVDGAAHAATA